MTSSLNPSVRSQSVTLTATVRANAPGSGAPTGKVTFKDGNRTLGNGTLSSSGQVSTTISNLSKGTHQITAVYAGSTHGNQRHMGNVWFKDKDHPEQLDLEAGANVTSLKDRFNVTRYLTPDSDLVALMILAHQTRLHNLISRVNWETRLALGPGGIHERVARRAGGHLVRLDSRSDLQRGGKTPALHAFYR